MEHVKAVEVNVSVNGNGKGNGKGNVKVKVDVKGDVKGKVKIGRHVEDRTTYGSRYGCGCRIWICT